jgi:AcrR family transcriptional regulator
MSGDDRTTRARIRDAAIAEIASRPFGSTTVRDVASAAGVSPGSVIHHFGSMDGLHRACNEHIAALIREYKAQAVSVPGGFDVLSAISGIRTVPVAAYLARAVLGDSPVVADLIDELVDDAAAYMEDGVEVGTITPTEDPRGRAALLVMWSLGGLVLHRHLERLLGVDLTDRDALATADAARYLRNALDLLAKGVLTDAYAEQLEESFARVWDDDAVRDRAKTGQKG